MSTAVELIRKSLGTVDEGRVKVTAPVVNLNGTSLRELIGQVTAARQGIRTAMDALGKAAPHGRDYQISPRGDFEKARKEFENRMQRLRSVSDELDELEELITFRGV